MDKALLVASLRQRLFADRGTDVAAAFDYCNMLIDSIPGGNEKIAARTALHVLANTVANAIEALPDQLPPPPAEVRISAEDNPATGAEVEPVIVSVPREELDRIIDARIVAWVNQDLRVEMAEWFRDEVDIDNAVQEYIDNSVDFTEIVRDEIKQNITFTVEVD